MAKRPVTKSQRLPPTVVVWVDSPDFHATLHERWPEDEDPPKPTGDGDVPSYILTMAPGMGPQRGFPLVDMTEEELLMLRDFVVDSINKAIPIARHLDDKAQKEFNNGNNTLRRLYRPAPRLYARPRSRQEHGDGLPIRLDEPSPIIRPTTPSHTAQHGGGLPDGNEGEGVGEDDDAPTVVTAVVGEVRGGQGFSDGLPDTETGTPKATPSP